MKNGALISACGEYRYWLTRDTGLLNARNDVAVFVMLNPSTADASADDPTIRRCIAFARSWGCCGLAVVNLYALRSTSPKNLWGHPDPVGPENDRHIAEFAQRHGSVVCAWGANAREQRVTQVANLIRDCGATLHCLGETKHGAPRHPLYLRKDSHRTRWPSRGAQ